jgi:tripartite-type tricarboxylate transporter receptor subunit TctC
MSLPKAVAAAMLVVIQALFAVPAHAQSYPSKPIRLIVPFPPGGSTDTVARVLGQHMSSGLGQPVVIDNRPGGNLFIGAEAAARSAPDGYTLFLPLDIVFTMNPFLFSKLPYNAEKDFAPISQLTSQTMWFVANPAKLAARSIPELVAYAKAHPAKVNYGSGAIVGQLTGELLRTLTGAEMTYVAFKGSAAVLPALLAGDVDLAVADITPFAPYIQQGKLNALGQTGRARSPLLPAVPTAIEQGVNGFEVTGWFGLYAPAGTPAPIINRLNAEVARILAIPEVREKLINVGVEPAPSSPEALAVRARDDAAKWSKLIKATGIKLD